MQTGTKGGGQQTCLMVVPTVSNVSSSSGLIRGYFGGPAALGFKTEEDKIVLQIYQFEGEAGQKGEVRTRTSTYYKSKRGRFVLNNLLFGALCL